MRKMSKSRCIAILHDLKAKLYYEKYKEAVDCAINMLGRGNENEKL